MNALRWTVNGLVLYAVSHLFLAAFCLRPPRANARWLEPRWAIWSCMIVFLASVATAAAWKAYIVQSWLVLPQWNLGVSAFLR